MRLIDANALLDKQESLYMKGRVLFHGVTAYAIENAPIWVAAAAGSLHTNRALILLDLKSTSDILTCKKKDSKRIQRK